MVFNRVLFKKIENNAIGKGNVEFFDFQPSKIKHLQKFSFFFQHIRIFDSKNDVSMQKLVLDTFSEIFVVQFSIFVVQNSIFLEISSFKPVNVEVRVPSSE